MKNLTSPSWHFDATHRKCLDSRLAWDWEVPFIRLGIIHLPAHAEWPWSEQRWQFVLQAMALVTDHIWIGDIMQLDTSAASSVTAQATLFPGYRQALSKTAVLKPVSSLLPNPAMACKSFSKFYERAQRDAGQFADLL